MAKKIKPIVISVGAEPFYDPIRKAIKTIWPETLIYNTYGASEGIAGVFCKSDNKKMHLNDDLCIVEPLDHNNKPVKKGVTSSKIYMTNLFNYTLPIIRYEIFDSLLFLKEQCECGVKHQLIAELQGKPSFDFVYSGGVHVPSILFATPLLYEKNIREYQVKQTERGVEIRLKTTGKIDYSALKENFMSNLMKLGLMDPEINFINIERFCYSDSGKLKRFIKLERELNYET